MSLHIQCLFLFLNRLCIFFFLFFLWVVSITVGKIYQIFKIHHYKHLSTSDSNISAILVKRENDQMRNGNIILGLIYVARKLPRCYWVTGEKGDPFLNRHQGHDTIITLPANNSMLGNVF